MNFLKNFLKSVKFLRRIPVIIIALSLLGAASFLGFVYYKHELYPLPILMSKEEKFFYKKLRDFAKSEKGFFALKELTNFNWDRACYAKPYGAVSLEELKDIKINTSLGTGLDQSFNLDDESRSKILFIDTEKKTGFLFVLNAKKKEVILIENSFSTNCMTIDAAIINNPQH